jgi:hypothetical protein
MREPMHFFIEALVAICSTIVIGIGLIVYCGFAYAWLRRIWRDYRNKPFRVGW